jgi:hypothetical protein
MRQVAAEGRLPLQVLEQDARRLLGTDATAGIQLLDGGGQVGEAGH